MPKTGPLETCDTTPLRAAPVAAVSLSSKRLGFEVQSARKVWLAPQGRTRAPKEGRIVRVLHILVYHGGLGGLSTDATGRLRTEHTGAE